MQEEPEQEQRADAGAVYRPPPADGPAAARGIASGAPVVSSEPGRGSGAYLCSPVHAVCSHLAALAGFRDVLLAGPSHRGVGTLNFSVAIAAESHLTRGGVNLAAGGWLSVADDAMPFRRKPDRRQEPSAPGCRRGKVDQRKEIEKISTRRSDVIFESASASGRSPD